MLLMPSKKWTTATSMDAKSAATLPTNPVVAYTATLVVVVAAVIVMAEEAVVVAAAKLAEITSVETAAEASRAGTAMIKGKEKTLSVSPYP